MLHRLFGTHRHRLCLVAEYLNQRGFDHLPNVALFVFYNTSAHNQEIWAARHGQRLHHRSDLVHGYQRTAIQTWDWAYDCARPPSVWLTIAAHPEVVAQVEQRLRPAAPHLPDELWLRIAGHLSTKEWVGASGTCRQLRQLQLEHLNMTAPSADGCISALLWLAKQLPGARSVVLDGWPVKGALGEEAADKIHSTMKAALSVPQSLCNLTILSVRLGRSDREKAEQMESVGGHPHMGKRLATVLVRAVRLSKLELICKKAYGIPPLRNLKHLALRLVKFPMSERTSTVLHEMPCLETLQLSHPFSHQYYTGEKVDAMLVVPASVQRVELIYLYPESLVLDSESTVVRVIGALCKLQKALVNWSNVSSQLRGLRLYRWCDDSTDMGPLDASELWGGVKVLQFTQNPMSHMDANLHGLPGASLGSLTSLHVQMANLCITIPALPGLKDLHIRCSATLCMSFEDAQVSADNLADLDLVYAGFCPDDTWKSFWAALKATGKSVAQQRYGKALRRLIICGRSVSGETREQRQYRMQYGAVVSDPWEDLFTACGCEGCMAGLGFDMKWTVRGHVSFPDTSSGGIYVHCWHDYLHRYLGTCPCVLHSISSDSDDYQ